MKKKTLTLVTICNGQLTFPRILYEYKKNQLHLPFLLLLIFTTALSRFRQLDTGLPDYSLALAHDTKQDTHTSAALVNKYCFLRLPQIITVP